MVYENGSALEKDELSAERRKDTYSSASVPLVALSIIYPGLLFPARKLCDNTASTSLPTFSCLQAVKVYGKSIASLNLASELDNQITARYFCIIF